MPSNPFPPMTPSAGPPQQGSSGAGSNARPDGPRVPTVVLPQGGAASAPSATELALDASSNPRCSVCGRPLAPGSSRCDGCRTVVGEANRCPHCQAIAEIAPSSTLRYVCRICGRPRVPMDGFTLASSSAETEALGRAGRASDAATFWRVAAIVVGGSGIAVLGLLGIVAMVIGAGAWLAILAIPTVLLSTVLPWAALRKSRARRTQANQALESGWSQAALELARQWGGIDARSLARATRIPEAEAERLLGRASAASQLTGSIADDGTLRYKLLESSYEAPSPYERPYLPTKG